MGATTATYDMQSADRMLLADLAGVETTPAFRDDAVAELGAGLRRAGRPVPVFAVLVDAPDELGALAGLRAMGDPAVVFLADAAPEDAAEVLADAGWLCVRFSAGDDPAECWQRALRRQRAGVGAGGD